MKAQEYPRQGRWRRPHNDVSLLESFECACGKRQSVILFRARIILSDAEICSVVSVLGVTLVPAVGQGVVC